MTELRHAYTYGSTPFGWGGKTYSVRCDETGEVYYVLVDYSPEWETKYDVRLFWKNRNQILKLEEMSIFRYTKLLVQGLRLYRTLK